MAWCNKKDCFWHEYQFLDDRTLFILKKSYGITDYIESCSICKYSLNARIKQLEEKISDAKKLSKECFLEDNHELDWVTGLDNATFMPIKYSDKCVVCGHQNCDGFEFTSYWIKKKCSAIVGRICFECLENNKTRIKRFIKKVAKEQLEKWEI